MTEQTSNNHYFKCPYCACIFFTEADLKKHTAAYGAIKEQHVLAYKNTHGRLEHGYGDE